MNKEQFTPFDLFMEGAKWQKSKDSVNALDWYHQFAAPKSSLIAAAPDMYEALKDLINDLDFHKENIHGVNGSYNRAKAALAKANPKAVIQ